MRARDLLLVPLLAAATGCSGLGGPGHTFTCDEVLNSTAGSEPWDSYAGSASYAAAVELCRSGDLALDHQVEIYGG